LLQLVLFKFQPFLIFSSQLPRKKHSHTQLLEPVQVQNQRYNNSDNIIFIVSKYLFRHIKRTPQTLFFLKFLELIQLKTKIPS
jgi:hypothetical protein